MWVARKPGVIAAIAILHCGVGDFWGALAADGVPDSRVGIRIAPILLLSRADVRTEVKLSPDQTAAAEEFISVTHDKALALKGRIDDAAVSARVEIDRTSQRWVLEHLTPP